MGLKEYKAKRNFSRTSEPSGAVVSSHKKRIFVVQKHAATRLHYDFRLEMEGVLKSWAVPKGFPWTKGDRRLAVQVEDHPFDYKDFEGIIPEGNYGAGTVMLWDKGTYTVSGDEPLKALEHGKLHLCLAGKKLKSEWTLVRMRNRDPAAKTEWLLLKSGDSIKALTKAEDDRSAVSGRSMAEIAREADATWRSNRSSSPGGKERSKPQAAPETKAEPDVDTSALPSKKPAFVDPMKACLAKELPTGDSWLYEVKFDGVRAIAVKNGGQVNLTSRTGNDLGAKYPELLSRFKELSINRLVMDGEIAALDSEGRSSFQVLQAYQMTTPQPPLVFYAFDILNLQGRDLTGLPLEKRKSILEQVLAGGPESLRFSPGLDGDPSRIVKEMQARGLEGLVAKQKDSVYEPGRRSRAWMKYKWVREQEFVIGGYTEPKGTRSCFGALLVGYYDKSKLIFAGKVGTGFDEASLFALQKRFKKLVQPECPFVNLPERSATGGLTAGQMKRCTWLSPELVGQVKFAEWTRDNHLRQPSFVGLREDKFAGDVVREQ